MVKCVRLRAKMYRYLIDERGKTKKQKAQKKRVVKRKRKFENYKNYLEGTQLDNKINDLEQIKLT